MRSNLCELFAVSLLAVFSALAPSPARSDYIPVYGGLTYTPGVGGLSARGVSFAPGSAVNNFGTAVGSAEKYDGSGVDLGERPVRWDASGTATELGNLGTAGAPYLGIAHGWAHAINDAGTAVGEIQKYDDSGVFMGWHAVCWDASGTAAIELGNLDALNGSSAAYAINTAGTAVGWEWKFEDREEYSGYRAVRWDAAGTATELGHLGMDGGFPGWASAQAINAAGTAAGNAQKYDDALGKDLGLRAVRWDASGTAATELGHLGTDAGGVTRATADAINSAGTAIGWAYRYDASGTDLGYRAVRWDATGTAATELGNLGTSTVGSTVTTAHAINTAGTAVGQAEKYDASGTNLGTRAVRWDVSGTAATELGNLGTSAVGFTFVSAHAINSAGIAAGGASKYDGSGMLVRWSAVVWGEDGLAIDLNTLIDPSSGWTLNSAIAISDTHFVAGIGSFDPDGPGGQTAYSRHFVMNISSAISEPLPGDYNRNGNVDAADYVAWRKGLGTTYTQDDYNTWRAHFGASLGPPGDLNLDGAVDAADYVVWRKGLGTTNTQEDYSTWRTHFGSSLGPGSGAVLPSAESLSAVPEPSSLWLITLATPALLQRRRSRPRPHVQFIVRGLSYGRGPHATRDVCEGRTRCSNLGAFLVLLLSVSAASTAFAAATLTRLGDLPGGNFFSFATGVSADGSVVDGSSASPSGGEAFRWTSAGGMVGLGDLPGGYFYSYAYDVSGDGSVVVGFGHSPSGREAFRWTAGLGMAGLGDLPGGVFHSEARGVSGDGSVVVGQGNSASGPEAFRWTSDGGMVGLGDLPGGGFDSEARAVSGDGSVVVGRGYSGSGHEAYRWTSGGGMIGLGDLPGGGFESAANGVSDDGSVVVGSSLSAIGAHQAFRWTSGDGMVLLGELPGGSGSWASSVSGDGSVVVGSCWAAGGLQAVRWTKGGGIERLWDVLLAHGVNPAAHGFSSLTYANDISADGSTIVGSGIIGVGEESFIAFIPIVPGPLPGDHNRNGNVDAADYVAWRKGTTYTQDDYNTWRAHFGASLGPPGDFNLDGAVDAADYVAWRKGLGTTYTQDDYNTWRAHFGASLGVGSGAVLPSAESLSAVPEPSSLWLITLATPALFERRRSRPRLTASRCWP